MPELRNVIVFAVGAERYALELRWVREVVSLGFVTVVPTAPPELAGVYNLHGTILPVLDVGALLGGPAGLPARQGDSALVIEVEGVACALRIDQVDQVASLRGAEGGHDGTEGAAVLDANGRSLTLLDAGALVRRAVERVAAAGAAPVDSARAEVAASR
ncbi:MAG: chemotaxis protein CheW [Kofleriaceae bacterium]